ncbi:hypothetical protein TRFO_36589 [Tritrichomonas foetus]|uniref:Uncharacterized protein n=1 Tax=Tritrichomonas foetus TaxID=1144522 RepID=A0A1J4JFY6_9EUKA|nr:hypothetical protein TRFO_36589 [Tritrichomonas foetus]|eukprot:OHS97207.1 hypothetical protein TRFO_36589 [Tritrichomonas foetus]
MMKSEQSPRISIVKPNPKGFEMKARANEAPVSSTPRKGLTLPPNRHFTPVSRGHTRLVLHGPPQPIEIQTLNKAKVYMLQLLKQLNQVVIENDATPDVQMKLAPLLENVNQNFPAFNRQAIKYYQSFYQIQDSTESAQVLSTASVKIPLEAFLKGWEELEKAIDIYAESHPPPHAKEISGKFDAIKSSLEIILQTNATRKYPNPGLGKSVLSIQSLCDSITNAVYELFMQERFPNFQIDSFKMYKEDVKSFLRVVVDAFYNEFPQSGVALCDLARIKLNVVASCNEIIEALKAAFVFPNSMKSIQKLKDQFNDEMKNIFDTLHQPFNVVKPKPREGEPLLASTPKPKTKEEETLERIAADDVEARLKNMDSNRKVELFLNEALPFFDAKLSEFSDPWQGLIYMNLKMKDFVKKYEVNDDEISKLRTIIENLKEEIDDTKDFVEQKSETAQRVEKRMKKEAEKRQTEIDELKFKISQLRKLINEKQEEIENISKADEVGELRRGLEQIANIINDQLNDSLEQNFTELSHRDLIDLTISMEATVIEEKQSKIDFLNEELTSLKQNIASMSNRSIPSKLSKSSSSKDPKRFDIDVPLFDTQPRDELKVSDNLSESDTSQTSSRQFSHSVSNSSMAVARRGEDSEKLKEELNSSREGHFADLRLVVSKLNDFVAGQYESQHKAVVEQIIDLDPVKTRIELMALISDQFEAIRNMIKALLSNDKENNEALFATNKELNLYKTRLSEALNTNENILDLAVNIITNKQNPLHDKILELSAELRKRDTQEMTILSRVNAISKQKIKMIDHSENNDQNTAQNQELYYQVRKTNNLPQILSILGDIQDMLDELSDQQKENEEKLKLMRNCFSEIEVRLKKGVIQFHTTFNSDTDNQMNLDTENDDSEMDNDEKIIERIYLLCDFVVSPRFSNQFLPVSSLDKYFINIPHDLSKHPSEFIPQVCQKYLEMQNALDAAVPYLTILDEIFQGMNAKNTEQLLLNTQKLTLLKEQIGRLHETLAEMDGSAADSHVSRLASRFIALVQALIDRSSNNDALL